MRMEGVVLKGPKTLWVIEVYVEYDVDLIGMPTTGRHGVLDALRGSTTQRVIRHAPCPVFAVPAPLTRDWSS
jgi:nucleotide-binding universal stress UspA family protein